MTARKGRIGRRPGKKRKCSQKHITKTSATLPSISLDRKYKESIVKLCESKVDSCSTLPAIDHKAHIGLNGTQNKEDQLNKTIATQKISTRSLHRSLKGVNNHIQVLKEKHTSFVEQSDASRRSHISQLKELKEESVLKLKEMKSPFKVSNQSLIEK